MANIEDTIKQLLSADNKRQQLLRIRAAIDKLLGPKQSGGGGKKNKKRDEDRSFDGEDFYDVGGAEDSSGQVH